MTYPDNQTLVEQIPGLESADPVQSGAQKIVYKAIIEGEVFALKLLRISQPPDDEESNAEIDAATARAQREVSILTQVDIPVLTRSGPIGLSTIETVQGKWIYFTEEWIEGTCVRDMISTSRFSPGQVAQLGSDLIQAVCWLSSRSLVHRDIKPANVIYDLQRLRYVLLDPGVALDLQGTSLTQGPFPMGTYAYMSPEQLDVARSPSLDFRSDLFAVGTVMYEAAVGTHPFMKIGTNLPELVDGIRGVNPVPVATRIDGFSIELSDFIVRLLGKQPHLRFRTCALAQSRIIEIEETLGATT